MSSNVPLAAHGPAKRLSERWELAKADVLEHADRDEDVEFAFHVPVVVVNELHAISEAFAAGAGARV